jgi:rod shape-determining protein MreC
VKTNLSIVFFVLLSSALMVADQRYDHLDALRNGLSTCLYPFHYLIQLPAEAGHWLSRNSASRSVLLEENAQLRRKQLLINGQLQRLTALEAENRRLRLLLESSVEIRQKTLIAELLNVDFDPYRHQVLLNKGTYHGIKAGQPLLNQRGIIGQISHASLLTASAILITDPNHVLPVQVNRNGLHTLAVGTGRFQELELPYVPNNEDIQVGDLLVTSGLGGRFPPGYPVAKVSKVEPEPSRPFARIVAQPTAQLERSREVLLLINDVKTDIAQTDSALNSD